MTFYLTDNSDFKCQHSFTNRLQESSRVLLKYPDRIPIICEKSKIQNNLPNIDKKKYLVPNDFTMGQFIYLIRKRINLKPEQSIFIFVNNKIISCSSTFGQIYETSKDNDGFLYLNYAQENVFG